VLQETPVTTVLQRTHLSAKTYSADLLKKVIAAEPQTSRGRRLAYNWTETCMSRLKNFTTEYLRHSALNFGQALQGIRYFYSHPKIDNFAKRGTFRHFFFSLGTRTKLILNDLFFAVIPPQWHHSKVELASLHQFSVRTWFEAGFMPWMFKDETLQKRTLTGNEDRRWDPRCDGR
jgi:hypothetical protein